MSFWTSPKGEALPDAFFDVARKVYEGDPLAGRGRSGCSMDVLRPSMLMERALNGQYVGLATKRRLGSSSQEH